MLLVASSLISSFVCPLVLPPTSPLSLLYYCDITAAVYCSARDDDEMVLYKYISPQGLEALKLYKYHCDDKSLVAFYIMQPFWRSAVNILPLWLAYVDIQYRHPPATTAFFSLTMETTHIHAQTQCGDLDWVCVDPAALLLDGRVRTGAHRPGSSMGLSAVWHLHL